MHLYKRYSFYTLLFISALRSSSSADIGDIIVLVGDPRSTHEGYTNGYRDSAKLAVSTIKEKYPESRQELLVGGGANSLDWTFAPEMQTAKSSTEFHSKLEAQVEKIDHSKSTIIFISDHGSAPNSAADPTSSAISVGNENGVSHSALGKIVSKQSGKRTGGFTHLISMHCYGGALHNIAKDSSKTCALASASWSKMATGWKFTPAIFGEIKKSEFDLNRDGKSSLLESYVRALNDDSKNFPMQQTSSMAYIDMVNKDGAYGTASGRDLVYEPRMNLSKAMIYSSLVRESKSLSSDANPICEHTSIGTATTGSVQSNIRDMDAILSPDLVAHPLLLSKDEQALLPQSLQSAYQNAVKSQKIRDLSRPQNQPSYNNEMEKLRGEWSTLRSKVSACGARDSSSADCSRVREDSEKMREAIVAKVDANFHDLKSSPKPAGNLTPFFLYFKKTAKFMKTASSEQKKKFQELVECESSPI